ncbi:hypothetical protein BJX63DRAFT_427801 [Aspergillus granulosus]|uniref:Uncharacterized protein n=1 Tax=Aspergillus granulosus TaxID=176169 RepID=A0ABR4I052_9EURO
MDLSSLEGPPILNSRFSSPPALRTHHAIPHIRLENVQSPVSPLESNSWDLPRRPASMSAIPPHNKPSNRASDRFWQSIQPESTSSNHRTGAPRSHRSHSSGCTTSRRLSTSTSSNTHARATLAPPSPQTTRSTPRQHSSSISTPHQLVWAESEQIWILTTRTAPPSSLAPQHHHHHRSLSSLAPVPNPTSPTTRLVHSRSMEIYPSAPMADVWNDVHDPNDLPPPYEQHIFDRPLGPIMPAVRRVPQEEVRQARTSRWAAIGRRVT